MSPDLRDAATRLTEWGVISAQGPDARSFLQNQLTQNMAQVSEQQARLAGWCSAKGRLLATFVVWQRAPDDFALACSADLLAPTLKRLSMFVLRAKCRLGDASAGLPLWGTTAPPAGLPVWGCDGSSIRLPDAAGVQRSLFVGAAAPLDKALTADAWRWLEVASGVPRIGAATVEQFVPQMVNLELVGGVDFSKGCYPGQEVVARSQYRGTLKRRGYVLDASVSLQPGQEVFVADDPGQPAGRVVLAARLDGRHNALAELKIAAAEGSAALLAGEATLTLAEQPYPLTAPA